MHTNTQSNYTNTKTKVWFMHLLCHPDRKRSGPISQQFKNVADKRMLMTYFLRLKYCMSWLWDTC